MGQITLQQMRKTIPFLLSKTRLLEQGRQILYILIKKEE